MAKKTRKSVAERAVELAENGLPQEELPSYIYAERRLRKNGRILRAICAVLAILLLVFVCLFVIAKLEFETRARESFGMSVDNAIVLIEQCKNSDFDYDRRYREICAELNIARQMLFWTGTTADYQICFNELYSSFLRLPNQARAYLPDICDGLSLIRKDKQEDGYSILQNVLSRMDKQDVLTDNATGS